MPVMSCQQTLLQIKNQGLCFKYPPHITNLLNLTMMYYHTYYYYIMTHMQGEDEISWKLG
jgi:hypothetical protein